MLHDLTVNAAGRTRCPAGWSLTPERTVAWRDLDAWYLIDGFGRVRTETEEVDIRPGDLLIMLGGSPYTFYRDSDVPFVHYWAHFDVLGPDERPVPVDHISWLPFHTRIGDMTFLSCLWERLVASFRSGEVGVRVAVWLSTIIAEAGRVKLELGGDSDCDPRVAACCRMIDDAPGERWAVSSLAKHAGVSRSQFFRLFQDSVGRAPQEYIVEARMRLARTLLRESTVPVASIAATVGYDDPRFFSRHFRRHNGRSPRDYREGGGPDVGGASVE